jgi:Na+-driven multidrug efflux pump
MGTILMLLLTVLCQWRPEALIAFFSKEPEVVEVGALFLRLISWNFVATGIVFTCSGMFQALGNTMPSLLSSATRLITYAIPAIWLSAQPGLRIEHIWYLSVATMMLQTVVSLFLLRIQLRERLDGIAAPAQA